MKKKIFIIGGAVLGVLLVSFILIGIFAPKPPETVAQPTPTAIQNVPVTTPVAGSCAADPSNCATPVQSQASPTTQAPTVKPTAKPAPTQAPVSTDPLLFGPLSSFLAKYGTPNLTDSTTGDTMWQFNPSQGTVESLTVFVFTDVGYHNQVEEVLLTVSLSASQTTAKNDCLQWAPHGYVYTGTSNDGTYDYYYYNSPGGKFVIRPTAGDGCFMGIPAVAGP